VEPWEHELWSSSPAFPTSVLCPRTGYALTDFRIVVRERDRVAHDIALDDIAAVRLEQGWRQRLGATSTVRVWSRTGRVIALRDIRHGPQLALILQLLATNHLGSTIDREFVETALSADSPPLLRPNHALAAAAAAVAVLALVVAGVAHHDTLAPITYSASDPIAPGGHRRPEAEIAAFMRREVMPFARRALAPIEGGAANVTCLTCHGIDAEGRHWKMPGVRALPEPDLRLAGMERPGFFLDPQLRNAVYGYLAEEDKLPTAAYMRGVVMPGMAAALHRPAYDFTRPYAYNRTRVAVGCYHCHMVN
jgi:Bacterial PH domain